MGAPIDGPTLTARKELGTRRVGILLQDSQVELDDAPTDDDVRVVPLEQLGAETTANFFRLFSKAKPL